MGEATKSVTVRVPLATLASIDALAESLGVTRSAVIVSRICDDALVLGGEKPEAPKSRSAQPGAPTESKPVAKPAAPAAKPAVQSAPPAVESLRPGVRRFVGDPAKREQFKAVSAALQIGATPSVPGSRLKKR